MLEHIERARKRALQKGGVAGFGFIFIFSIVLAASFLIFAMVLKTYRASPSSSTADRTPYQGGVEEEGDALYLTLKQRRGGAWEAVCRLLAPAPHIKLICLVTSLPSYLVCVVRNLRRVVALRCVVCHYRQSCGCLRSPRRRKRSKHLRDYRRWEISSENF